MITILSTLSNQSNTVNERGDLQVSGWEILIVVGIIYYLVNN